MMGSIRENVTGMVAYIGRHTGFGLGELYSLTIADLAEHADEISELIRRENSK